MKLKPSQRYYLLALFISLMFRPVFLFGQKSDSQSTYVWFDSVIDKTNSGIFSGLEYSEPHRMMNERHKFFMNPNFILGSVVYNNQPYYNLELKYDVFVDQLILRHSDQPNLPVIVLDTDKITSFVIEGHQFLNLQFKVKKGTTESGFFEILASDHNMVLLKKNHKRILKKTNERIRYYEFKSKNSHFIKYQGSFYDMNGINSLTRIFPGYKLQLKAIEKNHKYLKKDDNDAYLKSLIEEFSPLISQQAPSEI